MIHFLKTAEFEIKKYVKMEFLEGDLMGWTEDTGSKEEEYGKFKVRVFIFYAIANYRGW